MKKLSLLLDPSNSFRIIFFLVLVSLFAQCKRRDDSSVSANSRVATTPLMVIHDDIKPSWIPLKDSQGSSDEIIGWLGAASCLQPTMSIKTNFLGGIHSSELVIQQPWDGATAVVEVDDVSMSVEGLALGLDAKAALCDVIQSSGISVVLPTAISQVFRSNLERVVSSVAPDCRNVEWSKEGWVCALPTLMPQAAIIKIEEFQQAMAKKWSRQPYILARRAGVAMTLARTATNLSAEASLHKFCKLMKFSLAEELPLIMTSQRWQQSLCDGTDKQRREAAFYGLAKTIDELAMIRQLNESTSKPGTLSIKIPHRDIPGNIASQNQRLRVTFTPEDDVTVHLVEVAGWVLGRPFTSKRQWQRLVSLSADSNILEHRKPQCWHPLFSDSSGLMRIADGMKLTGEGFKGTCKDVAAVMNSEPQAEGAQVSGEHFDPLTQYLMQSLSSDTEFEIDNGQSRLIRLPEGKYRYSIQVLIDNPIDADEQTDDNAAETHGTLQWRGINNHAVTSW